MFIVSVINAVVLASKIPIPILTKFWKRVNSRISFVNIDANPNRIIIRLPVTINVFLGKIFPQTMLIIHPKKFPKNIKNTIIAVSLSLNLCIMLYVSNPKDNAIVSEPSIERMKKMEINIIKCDGVNGISENRKFINLFFGLSNFIRVRRLLHSSL